MSKLLDKLRKKIEAEGKGMGASNWPSVLVPQAPIEPDERIDKMTGIPYAMQAGGAFEDEEDRIGLASGWAEALRLVGRATRGRGSPSLASDIRPTTKFEVNNDVKDILTELRFRNKDNFIDPYDPNYSTTRLKINNEAEFEKYLLDNENINLKHFNTLPLEERETLIDIFNVTKSDAKSADDFLDYKRDNVEYHTAPDERYTIAKGEKKSQLLTKLNKELDSVPVEDIEIAKRYVDNIPKVDKTTNSSPTMTKEEFLKDSVEKEPQYNASFFGKTKHVARLSNRIPRELGLHVGKKGHAETMYIRGSVPRGESIMEEAGIDYYLSFPDVVDEIDAKVLTNREGVPDEIMDTLVEKMSEVNPTIKKIEGAEPILQKGYINVKNPFVLNTDMINWNPSKIFGGFDPEGALKLDEQVDILIGALESQTKMPKAKAKKIVDKLAEDIDSLVARKDLIEKEGFVGDMYEHSMNVLTREAMQDLGFDSIKYKNLGELARVSEKKAGGHSYILFKDDQFVTDFVERADAVVGDFVPKVKVKRGKVVKEYAGVSKIEVADEAEALQRAFPEEYAGKSKEDILADKEAFKKSREGLGFPRRRDQLSPEDVRTYQETQYNLARGIIPQIDQFKVMLDLLPVSKTTVMPERNTFNLLETSQVLKSNQLEDHGILGRTMRIEEGTTIASRIDIPVWDSYGVKAVTLHDVTAAGDAIGYALHSSQKNVTFRTQPKDASNIGRGLAYKGTIARVRGGWVNRTFDETYDLIKEIVENPTKYPDWVQVKMNPDIHSWFMDASTGLPLSRADDYLKVGDLAFAKNAVMPNGVLAQDTLTKYGSVLEAAEDIFNSKGFKEEFGYEAVGWKTPPKPIGGIDTPKEFYEGAKASPVSTTYNTGGKVLGSLHRNCA